MADETLFKVEHLPSGMSLYSKPNNDNGPASADNASMTEITRSELRDTLSAIEERMDKRIDRLAEESIRSTEEYRREIALRDEAFKREQALRDEAFKREQAVRDKAMDERFSSFLSVQAERDARVNQQFESITRDIDRLGSIKANVWGAMATTIIILLAVGALALTAFQAGSVKPPTAIESATTTSQSAPALRKPPAATAAE